MSAIRAPRVREAVWWYTSDSITVRCACGFEDDIDQFDVLGMEQDRLWCNKCQHPIKLKAKP